MFVIKRGNNWCECAIVTRGHRWTTRGRTFRQDHFPHPQALLRSGHVLHRAGASSPSRTQYYVLVFRYWLPRKLWVDYTTVSPPLSSTIWLPRLPPPSPLNIPTTLCWPLALLSAICTKKQRKCSLVNCGTNWKKCWCRGDGGPLQLGESTHRQPLTNDLQDHPRHHYDKRNGAPLILFIFNSTI